MIIVVDYGEGNVRSVQKAFEHLGQKTMISSSPEDIIKATHVVVPGQGAFKQAMSKLSSLNLITPIQELITKGVPFLGICLGFQILFEQSEEHGGAEGLGVFQGKCTHLHAPELKVPHMGWNTIISDTSSPMFKGIQDEDYVYFVHSYIVKSTSSQAHLATCEYGETFIAAIQQDNVWGTQFHPEKSGDVGLKLLTNFLREGGGGF